MWRTLSHQIWKEEYIVLSKFLNRSLLCCEILCLKNLLCPPFVTGSCAEHTSHQMITSICMAERMECIIFIYAKILAGNKYSSGCSKRNIALSITNCTCSNSCCRVISGTCNNFYIFWESKFFCNFRFQSSYYFPALIQFRKLFFCDTADFQHFLWPATVLYIKQKHTGSIGNICAERTRQTICQVIFRQHNFNYFLEILRFIFLHPENLRRCKSCKSNIGCIFREFLFSDHSIQILCFLACTAIVPENCRTDYVVIFVQGYQTMHLTAKTNSSYLSSVNILCQFFHTFHALCKPVFRFLLRPAWMREE